MNTHFDVILIGAGFAGAATAYHLSRVGGLRLLLLERETGYGFHASGKNAAMLRQAVDSLKTARWIQETRSALLDAPKDFFQSVGFQQHGSVLLGAKDSLLQLIRVMEETGGSGEIFSKGKYPDGVGPEFIKILESAEYEALLYSPGDGVVDVHALLGNFIHAAKSRGVIFQTGREVKDLKKEGKGWRVEGKEFSYSAELVILAAGPWCNEIGQSAGKFLPGLNSYRRHLFISDLHPMVKPDWPILWDIQNEFYLRPEFGGLLLSPGDEELHPPREPLSDPRAAELLAVKLTRFLPSLCELRLRRAWACLRSKGPSGLSYIDWDPLDAHLLWVCGLGGHGMSASFGIGRAAAEKVRTRFEEKSRVDGRKSVTG